MKTQRLLFASGSANLGGVQSSTHVRIRALAARGIVAEKLFLKSGAGRDTYVDVRTHITQRRRQMEQLVRRGRFDAISMINRIDLLPTFRRTRYRGRVLFEVRGRAKHALKACRKITGRDVGAIVVISDYVRELVARKLRAKDIPIYVVHNAVDTELFRPLLRAEAHFVPFAGDAWERPIVLWVGRLSVNKNYEEMLHIARLLVKGGRHAPYFWVVGDTRVSKRTAHFMQLVRELGLEDDVRLLSCVPHRHMVHVYNLVARSGGCVLSTSRSEGFQNSLLEAMACGVPVVSAAVGGNVELVEDGVSGRLYALGSPREGAAYVEKILGDARLRAIYGAAGLARVRAHHTPADHAKAFLRVLEETRVRSHASSSLSGKRKRPKRRRKKRA